MPVLVGTVVDGRFHEPEQGLVFALILGNREALRGCGKAESLEPLQFPTNLQIYFLSALVMEL